MYQKANLSAPVALSACRMPSTKRRRSSSSCPTPNSIYCYSSFWMTTGLLSRGYLPSSFDTASCMNFECWFMAWRTPGSIAGQVLVNCGWLRLLLGLLRDSRAGGVGCCGRLGRWFGLSRRSCHPRHCLLFSRLINLLGRLKVAMGCTEPDGWRLSRCCSALCYSLSCTGYSMAKRHHPPSKWAYSPKPHFVSFAAHPYWYFWESYFESTVSTPLIQFTLYSHSHSQYLPGAHDYSSWKFPPDSTKSCPAHYFQSSSKKLPTTWHARFIQTMNNWMNSALLVGWVSLLSILVWQLALLWLCVGCLLPRCSGWLLGILLIGIILLDCFGWGALSVVCLEVEVVFEICRSGCCRGRDPCFDLDAFQNHRIWLQIWRQLLYYFATSFPFQRAASEIGMKEGLNSWFLNLAAHMISAVSYSARASPQRSRHSQSRHNQCTPDLGTTCFGIS